MKVYQELARLIAQRLNLLDANKKSSTYSTNIEDALDTCEDNILFIMKKAPPRKSMAEMANRSGSGIDSKTKIDFTKSSGEKLVLITAFQHKRRAVIVIPSLQHNYLINITGNKDTIKEYLYEQFKNFLNQKLCDFPEVL
jgi:hypothetical protein